MRRWALLAGIAVAAALAAVLIVRLDDDPEALIPGPAALFLLTPDEVGPGFAADPASVGRWEASALDLPDFYGERDTIPVEVFFAVTGDLANVGGAKQMRGRLEDWRWSGTAAVALAHETAPQVSVRQAASLFRTEEGARAAFQASLPAAVAAAARPDSPGLGDESLLYQQPDGSADGGTEYTFLMRQDNLVVRMVTDGATREEVLAWAAIVEEKATAQRPLRLPPEVSPTPKAQPPWKGKDGKRPPPELLSEAPGPRHCGWEDMLFLTWQGRSFVRDYAGELASTTAGRFAAAVALPADAAFTGYRSGNRELWVQPGTPDAVYIKDGGIVERWPALLGGCA